MEQKNKDKVYKISRNYVIRASIIILIGVILIILALILRQKNNGLAKTMIWAAVVFSIFGVHKIFPVLRWRTKWKRIWLVSPRDLRIFHAWVKLPDWRQIFHLEDKFSSINQTLIRKYPTYVFCGGYEKTILIFTNNEHFEYHKIFCKDGILVYAGFEKKDEAIRFKEKKSPKEVLEP